MSDITLAELVMQRSTALGNISEDPDYLTRTYGSVSMQQTNNLVADWMRAAGMDTHQDAIGNIVGYYSGATPNAKTLLLGSHLDTVRNAGKFDGPLGVLIALACVEKLNQSKTKLPFAIKVVGFCDEEGVRFQSTYLGSKALAGTLGESDLNRTDTNGVSLSEAIKQFGGNPNELEKWRVNAGELIGYCEVHIEQGPVLEAKNLAVGVVTAVAGQSRVKLNFTGRAGHAGTTPMALRKDALCAAADFILAVEKTAKESDGLVATVGQINTEPGASNVIPGLTSLTVDIRHQNDYLRETACIQLQLSAEQITKSRGLSSCWQLVQENRAVHCDPTMTQLLKQAAQTAQNSVPEMPSGAGHDAAVMASITPATMLFVRCKGGVSHHPDESVEIKDVATAIVVMNEFIQLLAKKYG